MAFYYSKVLKALHANLIFCKLMRVPSSFCGKYLRTKRDRELNSAWTVLIILIVFVVCWMPFHFQWIYLVSSNFRISDIAQLYLVTIANLFYFVGCCANPLICIFRCTRFRKECKRIVLLLLKHVSCCFTPVNAYITEESK